MRLLVLEDEVVLARSIRRALEQAGHIVDVVDTVAAGVGALGTVDYDLLVLDRQVLDGDGVGLLDFARRAKFMMPAMFLTARAAVDERVNALNRGADDYLTKPFEMAELLARVTALLRRPRHLPISALVAGNIIFDRETRSATVEGQPLAIARREGMLLEQLVSRGGQVVTREILDARLFGFDDETSANAIEASVSRLRKALSTAGADRRIHTVRGLGYCLAP